MENEGKRFDQQVHDAFEHIELSEEAQDRMLGALLAAQARKQAEQAADSVARSDDAASVLQDAETEVETVPSPFEEQGKVIEIARRRFGWHALLPLAAVLVLAVVVVSFGTQKSTMSESNAVMSEAASEAKGAADASEADGGSAESTSMEAEADDAAAAETDAANSVEESADTDALYARDMMLVDYYPCITLADGTRLTALRDGLHAEEVASSQVGELVGSATATVFDDSEGTDAVSCEVFSLKGEADAFAVRYEGEETYWRATATD